MLPGATIIVERNAKLSISAKISGVCDEMWQGIVVKGTESEPQFPNQQGTVAVHGSGIIQDAKVGIDVQTLDSDDVGVNGSGGGIVHAVNGRFINNEISIRFGEYGGRSNNSQIIFSHFEINDDYRSEIPPVFIDLNEIRFLKTQSNNFIDARIACEKVRNRAIGIRGFNAGFEVETSQFTDLYKGIDTRILTEGAGLFLLKTINSTPAILVWKPLNVTIFTYRATNLASAALWLVLWMKITQILL